MRTLSNFSTGPRVVVLSRNPSREVSTTYSAGIPSRIFLHVRPILRLTFMSGAKRNFTNRYVRTYVRTFLRLDKKHARPLFSNITAPRDSSHVEVLHREESFFLVFNYEFSQPFGAYLPLPFPLPLPPRPFSSVRRRV